MRCIIYLFILMFPCVVFGTNYYSDPNTGNMNNPGSFISPFGSLEDIFAANTSFQSGDTIFLRNGNHGYAKIDGVNNDYVTVTPQAGHNPVLDRISVAFTSYARKWCLDGLTIQSEKTGQYGDYLVELRHNSSYITVKNCRIQSIEWNSSWTRTDWRGKANHGVRAWGNNHLIVGNNIRNIGFGVVMEARASLIKGNRIQYYAKDGVRAVADYCIYEENFISDPVVVYLYNENHYDAIQSFSEGPGQGTIYGNIIRNNKIINYVDYGLQFRGPSQGIGGFDGMYENWVIENNLIIIDSYHGITFLGAVNCKIVNNTVVDPYDISPVDPYDPSSQPIVGPCLIWLRDHKVDGSPNSGLPSSGNLVRNNIAPDINVSGPGNSVSYNSEIGASSNYFSVFNNYPSYDYHLKVTSVAVDAGTLGSAPAFDFDGIPRPIGGGVDNGAFEYFDCTVDITPVASLTQICKGQNVTLFANGAHQYYWSDGITSGSTFTPDQTYEYFVTGVNNQGCVGKDSITITVLDVTKPTVLQNGNTLSSSVSGTSYQWLLNGNQITGATNSTYTVTTPGDYQVEVIQNNGCWVQSDPYLVLTVGEIAIDAENMIQMYPNPVENTLNIKKGDLSITKMNIHSINGQLIRTLTSFKNNYDLSELSSGVYYINIYTKEGNILKKKFVKK